MENLVATIEADLQEVSKQLNHIQSRLISGRR